ncbi:MAG: TIGR04086 family membrane protein [Clostridiales bacterium]|nr:TIGR04086 family membrane protein [Clostridiales bacterium]
MTQKEKASPLITLFAASALGAGAALLLLVLSAGIFHGTHLSISWAPPVIRVIWVISALISGKIAAGANGSPRILWGLGCGTVLFLLWLVLALLFSQGSFSLTVKVFLELAFFLAGGLAGAILS